MDNPLIQHYLKQAAIQRYLEEQKKGKIFADRPDQTPTTITELKPDEVFVFGSDLRGRHTGGCALYAYNHFGAKMGIGRGFSGQSYAIPTHRIPLDELKGYIEEFLQFARDHEYLLFYVTKIGCGRAGHTINEIAPLFRDALELDNVRLPAEFVATLNLNFDPKLGTKAPKAARTQNYGQVRTLADIAMTLNAQNHYDNPQVLLADLNPVLYLYRIRGTVTDDALDSFKAMLEKNAASWFTDGYFDTDKMFAHLQQKADNDAMMALDMIYQRRAMAKIGRVVMLMNEIARYTDVKTLMSDIHRALKEEDSTLDDSHNFIWDDSFHYPLFFFEQGVQKQWENIIDNDGHLDNEKFAKVMFDDHEKRVEELGLAEVIRRDYEDDGPCHPEVFMPKEVATGPIYVEMEEDTYIKSCGEGKGPNRYPERYEMQFLLPVLERLCQGDNPEYINANVFMPIRDYSRPVYSEWGKVVFRDDAEKKLYLMERLKEYKAQQKKDEQP